jgi:hypothetical protein
MAQTKTERSNCRFVVQQTLDGKSLIVVQPYHDTISALQTAVLGFDLLAGTRLEQARKITELLNEHVLDVFVTLPDAAQ